MLTERAWVCPDSEDLRRFLLGEVSDQEIEETERHLAQCPRCLETVQELDAEDTLVEALQAQVETPSDSMGDEIQSLIHRLQGVAQATITAETGVDMVSSALADSQIELPATGIPGSSPVERYEDCYRFLRPPQQAGEQGRLGVYRILGVLGSGGMGIVFRAEDPRLNRLVALKVMRPAFLDHASARQRFLREARMAAAVEHEHIVHVNDVGEDQGIPYVCMPLLQGENLDTRMGREGWLPLAEVLRIGRETAEGLSAAHARGLIHRDIKPANIWLEGERGRVKILDFGLARPVQDSGQVTRSGFVVGTPAFMAPEQAQGGTIDARADLFSLGCVLYRIATGQLPFPGTTALQVLHALISDEPAPARHLNPDLPPALEELIQGLLSRDPAQRPASAQDVVERLTLLEGGEPEKGTAPSVLAPAARPGPRRKVRLPRPGRRSLAIALVILLAVACIYGPTLFRIVGNRGELAIETDRDVLVVLHKDGRRVRILHAEQTSSFDVPAGEYHVEVQEAPAGASLCSYDFRLPRGGRAVIAANPTMFAGESSPSETPAWPMIFSGVGKTAYGVAFSPDGRLLAAAGDGKAMVWELATKKVSVVLAGERGVYTHVAFSPDSKQLAANDLFSFIRVWDLADGKAPTTKQVTAETKGLTWSPDGKRILSGAVRWRVGGPTDTRGFVQAWDPDSGETTMVYCTELEQVPTNVAYSPDGRLVAASMFRWNPAKSVVTMGDVRLWDAQTGTLVHTLHGSRTDAAGLAFSPDGKQLARGAGEGTVERWEVATGQNLPSLRSGAKQSVLCVVFSPDGRWLASTGRDAAITIWNMATGKSVLVLRAQGTVFGNIAYSPDGHLLAAAGVDGFVRVWDVTQAP